MYEVTFSEQSMDVLNEIELHDQLELVDRISSVTSQQLANPREPLSRLRRDNIDFFRLRAGNYRFYFVVQANQLFCHYVLHRNTMADFAFRNRLKMTAEQLIEQDQSFWRYLESLKKSQASTTSETRGPETSAE